MYKCTVCKSRMNEAERFSHRSLCMDSQTLRKRKSDEIDSSGSSNYCYEGTEVGRMSQSKMKMQRAYISLPCTDIRKYVDPSQKLNHRILCHRNVSISVKPKSEYLESTSASCESIMTKKRRSCDVDLRDGSRRKLIRICYAEDVTEHESSDGEPAIEETNNVISSSFQKRKLPPPTFNGAILDPYCEESRNKLAEYEICLVKDDNGVSCNYCRPFVNFTKSNQRSLENSTNSSEISTPSSEVVEQNNNEVIADDTGICEDSSNLEGDLDDVMEYDGSNTTVHQVPQLNLITLQEEFSQDRNEALNLKQDMLHQTAILDAQDHKITEVLSRTSILQEQLQTTNAEAEEIKKQLLGQQEATAAEREEIKTLLVEQQQTTSAEAEEIKKQLLEQQVATNAQNEQIKKLLLEQQQATNAEAVHLQKQLAEQIRKQLVEQQEATNAESKQIKKLLLEQQQTTNAKAEEIKRQLLEQQEATTVEREEIKTLLVEQQQTTNAEREEIKTLLVEQQQTTNADAENLKKQLVEQIKKQLVEQQEATNAEREQIKTLLVQHLEATNAETEQIKNLLVMRDAKVTILENKLEQAVEVMRQMISKLEEKDVQHSELQRQLKELQDKRSNELALENMKCHASLLQQFADYVHSEHGPMSEKECARLVGYTYCPSNVRSPGVVEVQEKAVRRIVKVVNGYPSHCTCVIINRKKCSTDDCPNRKHRLSCPPTCDPLCQNNPWEHDTFAAGKKTGLKMTELGWGVFATAFIPKDTLIGEYTGIVALTSEGLPPNEMPYLFSLPPDGCVIQAYKQGSVMRCVNHSCDPNLDYYIYIDKEEFKIVYYALVDIPLNTELTVNYRWLWENAEEAMRMFLNKFVGTNGMDDPGMNDPVHRIVWTQEVVRTNG
ncbi:unnamed protein product [Orchesella dallaii]|uniref:SET domain-containing protein n=1 Tax=Orchesella dallaii TaxID=48710 RepID=A0ABP1PSS4_9HEXA